MVIHSIDAVVGMVKRLPSIPCGTEHCMHMCYDFSLFLISYAVVRSRRDTDWLPLKCLKSVHLANHFTLLLLLAFGAIHLNDVILYTMINAPAECPQMFI